MKENNNPTSSFFNFDIYQVSDSTNQIVADESNKSIMVLTQSAGADAIALLSKIIQAVGKNMEKDVLLINEQEIRPYNELPNFHFLLVFGILPKEMGLHINTQPYQITTFQNKKILFAHDLTAIAQNTTYKKQLWVQLQTLFK